MRKTVFIFFLFLISINGIGQNNLDEIKFLMLSSKYSEALDACNTFISNNPDNADLYYYQALINKLLFRYTEADKSIQNALVLDSANIDYLAESGFILLKRDKEREAQKVTEKVIEKNPYHISSGISLSNMYLKQKKPEKAEKILMDLYSKDTINGFIARNIGLCGYKQADSKKSIKWFSRAIQLDSTDIKAYKFLFTVYAAKEECDLAFEIMDLAVKVDPQNIVLYKMIGDLNVTRNHNFKAVPAYLKAFEIDSTDEEIARKLGLCYYKIKKYEKAKYYLLIASKELDLSVYKHLGYIYKRFNEPDSSTMFFTKALDILRPDNNSIFDIYVNVAENYFALNNYNHTIGLYKRALKLELKDIWIIDSKNKVLVDLASVYADKLNDKENAIKYLKEVTKDIYINDDNYYEYAQQQITKLKEELFMEGKLKM